MLEKIKIGQHNTSRGREILQSCFEVAIHEDIEILLVQEPYTFRSSDTGYTPISNTSPQSHTHIPLNHPAFHLLTPCSQQQLRPRVLTYLKKSSHWQVTPRFDLVMDPDYQILEVTASSESFFIIHIYNEKPTTDIYNKYTIERFLDNREVINKPFLLLGDLNLHHTSWNPQTRYSSAIAEQLVNFLDKNHALPLMNFSIIEEHGGTFHRPSCHTTSIIDLAFVAGFRIMTWSNWRYAESTGSDHEFITFEGHLEKFDSSNKNITGIMPARFNLKKADWKLFEKFLLSNLAVQEQRLNQAKLEQNHDGVASILQSYIHDAALKAIPIQRTSTRSKPWWSVELTHLRKTFHTLQRRAKKRGHIDSSLIEEARVARNNYFHTISRTKNEHWASFLSNTKGKQVFQAYRYTRSNYAQMNQIPSLKYSSNNGQQQVVATTFEEKATALIENLFPMTTDPSSDLCPTHLSTNSSSNMKWEWPELTLEELVAAVPNKQTAPGMDRLEWTIIKAAITTIPKFFLNSYRYLFNCGHHPSQWKQAVGIIIPKRNKKDYTEPKAYRPISLLPCLSKLLERVFANRLAHFANTTDNLLHHSQMGGRKQRSAVDAVLLLQEFAERNLASRKIVSTVFLDIMGAFDRLQPKSLINTLTLLSLPTSFISWTRSFLSGRKIQLLFNDRLSKEYSVSGTPQGSPISPILFLLSVSHLYLRKVNPHSLQLSYMDDFAISVASSSVTKNIKFLTEATNDLFLLAANHSITFEIQKTELLHFHRKRQPVEDTLNIQETTLKPKQIVRWLGIWLDQKLTFEEHIHKRLQLANGALQNIKRLTSPSWGLQLNKIRHLYISCVTPVLDYGSILWQGKYGTEKHSNKCQLLQNMAVRIITGAYYGSPAKALEVECAILPCRVRHLKLALNYALRILKLQHNHPIQECLFASHRDELTLDPKPDFGLISNLLDNKTQLVRLGLHLQNFMSRWRFEHSNFSWNPPWRSKDIVIIISKENKEKSRVIHERSFQNIHPRTAIIYTDGSKTPGKGSSIGFIIYLPYTREMKCYSFNLGNTIGITDAETYCILKALQTLKKLSCCKECHIFSDSQAALYRIRDAPNQFSHQIRQYTQYFGIILEWCPGHASIEGNEIADKLARNGADLTIYNKDKYVTFSALKEWCRQEILNAWSHLWNKELLREEEGRAARGLGKFYRLQAKRSLPQFKTKAFHYGKFSRKTQSAYIQARMGIGNIRSYLHKIGKTKTSICNFCDHGRQTSGHLLLYCKKFASERKESFRGIEPLNLNILFNTKRGRDATLIFLSVTKCMEMPKGD